MDESISPWNTQLTTQDFAVFLRGDCRRLRTVTEKSFQASIPDLARYSSGYYSRHPELRFMMHSGTSCTDLFQIKIVPSKKGKNALHDVRNSHTVVLLIFMKNSPKLCA
ncbi:hypothetical protein TcasGA2_TC000295 [Tribolium castaneum]|uniref:Uncharacterized protein n=1 Tax=Tribolium castaneum TaxID=7070 RepID=D6WBB5_TRICA|nr:hypothetical protein TcasGA2_TC000295 [Tribolium castaneum]